jgi:hypothetical protein
VITAKIDTRDLMRQINRRAKQFGESNRTAVARWGVATCRSLVKDTQVWGTGTKAKKKQEMAIMKDANRAVFNVSETALAKKVKDKTLKSLWIKGQMVEFTPDRVLSSADEVVDFINLNRTSRKARVPNLSPSLKGITTSQLLTKAVKIKSKSAGKAKGGWIGAGIGIGRGQKEGSRITIGKNYAGYAHKHSGQGKGRVTTSVWSPQGMLENKVPYSNDPYVLKKNDIGRAVAVGGRMTLKWYESAIRAKLRKKV